VTVGTYRPLFSSRTGAAPVRLRRMQDDLTLVLSQIASVLADDDRPRADSLIEKIAFRPVGLEILKPARLRGPYRTQMCEAPAVLEALA
jgi:hypothetical protein